MQTVCGVWNVKNDLKIIKLVILLYFQAMIVKDKQLSGLN